MPKVDLLRAIGDSDEVILISNDGVRFSVHKSILSEVFRDMLTPDSTASGSDAFELVETDAAPVAVAPPPPVMTNRHEILVADYDSLTLIAFANFLNCVPSAETHLHDHETQLHRMAHTYKVDKLVAKCEERYKCTFVEHNAQDLTPEQLALRLNVMKDLNITHDC